MSHSYISSVRNWGGENGPGLLIICTANPNLQKIYFRPLVLDFHSRVNYWRHYCPVYLGHYCTWPKTIWLPSNWVAGPRHDVTPPWPVHSKFEIRVFFFSGNLHDLVSVCCNFFLFHIYFVCMLKCSHFKAKFGSRSPCRSCMLAHI